MYITLSAQENEDLCWHILHSCVMHLDVPLRLVCEKAQIKIDATLAAKPDGAMYLFNKLKEENKKRQTIVNLVTAISKYLGFTVKLNLDKTIRYHERLSAIIDVILASLQAKLQENNTKKIILADQLYYLVRNIGLAQQCFVQTYPLAASHDELKSLAASNEKYLSFSFFLQEHCVESQNNTIKAIDQRMNRIMPYTTLIDIYRENGEIGLSQKIINQYKSHLDYKTKYIAQHGGDKDKLSVEWIHYYLTKIDIVFLGDNQEEFDLHDLLTHFQFALTEADHLLELINHQSHNILINLLATGANIICTLFKAFDVKLASLFFRPLNAWIERHNQKNILNQTLVADIKERQETGFTVLFATTLSLLWDLQHTDLIFERREHPTDSSDRLNEKSAIYQLVIRSKSNANLSLLHSLCCTRKIPAMLQENAVTLTAIFDVSFHQLKRVIERWDCLINAPAPQPALDIKPVSSTVFITMGTKKEELPLLKPKEKAETKTRKVPVEIPSHKEEIATIDMIDWNENGEKKFPRYYAQAKHGKVYPIELDASPKLLKFVYINRDLRDSLDYTLVKNLERLCEEGRHFVSKKEDIKIRTNQDCRFFAHKVKSKPVGNQDCQLYEINGFKPKHKSRVMSYYK